MHICHIFCVSLIPGECHICKLFKINAFYNSHWEGWSYWKTWRMSDVPEIVKSDILQVSQEASSTSAINPTTTLCWPALFCHICKGPGIWGLKGRSKGSLALACSFPVKYPLKQQPFQQSFCVTWKFSLCKVSFMISLLEFKTKEWWW